jgi:hypothetical protein
MRSMRDRIAPARPGVRGFTGDTLIRDTAHAQRIHLGEQRVRRALVDVDDAATACDTDRAHGVKHAGIVAPIGARLHEHETRDPEPLGKIKIVRKRGERRCVAQLFARARAVGIALRRAEHVEMCIAGEGRRPKGGRRLFVVIQWGPLAASGCAFASGTSDHHVDASGHHLGDGGGDAAERNMLPANAGGFEQEFHPEMGRRAGPSRAKAELAGLLFGKRDEVGQRACSEARTHQQDRGRNRDLADLGEV